MWARCRVTTVGRASQLHLQEGGIEGGVASGAASKAALSPTHGSKPIPPYYRTILLAYYRPCSPTIAPRGACCIPQPGFHSLACDHKLVYLPLTYLPASKLHLSPTAARNRIYASSANFTLTLCEHDVSVLAKQPFDGAATCSYSKWRVAPCQVARSAPADTKVFGQGA